jgi:hypothetical protein
MHKIEKPDGFKYKTVKEIIFDTIMLPENVCHPSQMATAFVIAVGQYAGRALKDYRHTNILQPGMLCAPQQMAVHSLSTALRNIGGNYISIEDRWWDGNLDFSVGFRTTVSGPIRSFADRRLLYEISEIPSSEAADPADFPEPIAVIRQQECFSCRLSFKHAVNVPLDLVIGLRGILYVPEQ